MRALTVVLALVCVTSCVADPGDPLDDPDAELDELALGDAGDDLEAGKADGPDLALTPLDLPVPTFAGNAEVRLLIRGEAVYRALFGASAPRVDFSRKWVAFYSAGVKPTGGFDASIDRVWTSNTGKTLRVATRLRTPGPGCTVTKAFTTPHAAVAFMRPAKVPDYLVAYHTTVAAPACTAECRTVAPTDLASLHLDVTREVRAVFFTPSDRPFRACLHERLDAFAHLAQDFYRAALADEGIAKSFVLDTAADGTWDVVYVSGEHDSAWYQAQPDPPGAAMAEMLARLPAAYHQRNVTMYLYDLHTVSGRTIRYSGNGGSGAPWEGEGTGYVLQGAHFLGLGFETIALDPAQQGALFTQAGDAGVDDWNGDQVFGPLTRGQYASTYVGAALHELGHAFYLDHVFTDDDGDGIETNLMGNGFRRLGGRYAAGSYQPFTALGAETAAALDAAWMIR